MRRFGMTWCVPANGNHTVRHFVVSDYPKHRDKHT